MKSENYRHQGEKLYIVLTVFGFVKFLASVSQLLR